MNEWIDNDIVKKQWHCNIVYSQQTHSERTNQWHSKVLGALEILSLRVRRSGIVSQVVKYGWMCLVLGSMCLVLRYMYLVLRSMCLVLRSMYLVLRYLDKIFWATRSSARRHSSSILNHHTKQDGEPRCFTFLHCTAAAVRCIVDNTALNLKQREASKQASKREKRE